MRLLRLALVTSLLSGLMFVAAPVASADCSGPSLSVIPTSAGAGQAVTIHGQYFGTNCYDTGPPPPGQGFLGEPATGVGVYFGQGESTTPLTTVDADADYEFSVEVTVPADAVPGTAYFATDAPDLITTVAMFTVLDAAAPIELAPVFTG